MFWKKMNVNMPSVTLIYASKQNFSKCFTYCEGFIPAVELYVQTNKNAGIFSFKNVGNSCVSFVSDL